MSLLLLRFLAAFALTALFALAVVPPTLAASAPAASVPSVSSRLDILEAQWGHIRLGGEFDVLGDVYRGRPYASGVEDGERFLPGFNQNMKIRLDDQVTREFSLSLLLSHQGYWGVSTPSDGNIDKPPLTAPFLIDEAAVRFQRPRILADFGRFRFTLDPMGLLTDHTSYPLEGMALQTNINGVYLGGYYSCLSSVYRQGSLHVITADDELALRIALPRPAFLLGLTWLPTGLAHESAWGIDYTGWFGRRGFRMTVARYQPSPDNYPKYNPGGGWGFLAHGDLIPGETQSLGIKLGYFQPGFTPTFSRLAYAVAGDTEGEPFNPNTQGIALYYNRTINRYWDIAVDASILRPVTPDPAAEAGRKTTVNWEVKGIRHFSPQTSLTLGCQSYDTAAGRGAHVYAGLSLHF